MENLSNYYQVLNNGKDFIPRQNVPTQSELDNIKSLNDEFQ